MATLRRALAALALAPGLLAQMGQGEGPGTPPAPSAPAHAPAPADQPLPRYVLSYDLKLRLRSTMVDTDLWAGGKLLMRGQRRTDGSLGLGLDRPLEDPWKFFWYSAGLAGSGVFASGEVAPGAPAYSVRQKAETRAVDFMKARHAAWKREWGGSADMDRDHPPCVFTVLGSTGWRFKATARPSGKLDGIENLMTHQWVPDGIRKWEGGSSEIGYSFWAADPAPPSWEPNTYKAFAAALALLDVPGFDGWSTDKTVALGPQGRYELQQYGVPQKAVKVVEVLLPRAQGKIPGWANPKLAYHVVKLDAATLEVEGESAREPVSDGEGVKLHLVHHLTYDRAQKMMAADRITVELDGGADKQLTLKVGYEPQAH